MIRGFTFDGGETTERYDYTALDNLPETDIGNLDYDTTAAASTVDGQLTAALTALGWLNDVIVS